MSINFSENLKKLRKKASLTQKQLSSELEVALSTVAMWETGSRQPDYTMLNQIAEFFNVSFDTLLGGKDTPPQSAEEEVYVTYEEDDIYSIRELLRTRPELKILLSVSRTASREDIERTVAVLKALKGSEYNHL